MTKGVVFFINGFEVDIFAWTLGKGIWACWFDITLDTVDKYFQIMIFFVKIGFEILIAKKLG